MAETAVQVDSRRRPGRGRQQPAEAGWQTLTGLNLAYALELYERFLANPEAVDEATRQWFVQAGPPPAPGGAPAEAVSAPARPGQQAAVVPAELSETVYERVTRAQRLVRNIRQYGHLAARFHPLAPASATVPLLDPAACGLTEADLAAIPARWVWPSAPADVPTAWAAVQRLRELYTGTLAFEFWHLPNPDEHAWFIEQIEQHNVTRQTLSQAEAVALLHRLIEVEEFEHFLHRTFVGQKRFSIEGVDMLVPMLDRLILRAVEAGAHDVMIGMAHRGRLNVLAHVLGKPYTAIFSEFHTAPNKELVPSEGSMGINYGWTGDVKYHLGASRTMGDGREARARVRLANNPSHLEFVNPVVEGFARAAQDDRRQPGYPRQDVNVALAVLIHGDAAFPGEGIVAETLNLSRLAGYHTGGTVHIIANNLLGFTAEPQEGRSTRYASDLAKGFEIPVVHVSADDPEACLAAIELAHAYRQQFHKDFLIDLVGYRRWGHNESDDPAMTQPQLYAQIQSHPTVRRQYTRVLATRGWIQAQAVEAAVQDMQQRLREAYHAVTGEERQAQVEAASPEEPEPVMTGVPLAQLQAYNEALLRYPEGFHVYPKLDRILQRRRAALAEGGRIDWGHAEALAFASILADGVPIRLTGQDSERGTFGHRHLVLHDVQTGARYSPLHVLPQAKASFDIRNSPLSEAAVLGFEYGYDVQSRETLVLWEAQFGDFANVAQVMIDQFLSAGLAKWGQTSGLVLLLPHGYEGQGPEHSSARLERYLQLSAEGNWRVVYPTSAAQYFHLLRDQAHRLQSQPRPLIVMTPKSLLRNPRAAASVQDLVHGSFQPVWVEPLTAGNRETVERVLLCTGKIGVELAAALEAQAVSPALAVLRLEQLYPFPANRLTDLLSRYPHAKEFIWVQEEPRNMGAWSYVAPRLQRLLAGRPLAYVGRPARSSPAEGIADAHEVMQKQIVARALALGEPLAAEAEGDGDE
ncbi:MAG: 2-oxoglutarate dehydrogenase E1 component [Alicyclobacillus sp.]|nr:2-oxoglutarate dehydrogenase E1 component [Alicyclobacillus sp.]